jgi:hypothetical protein
LLHPDSSLDRLTRACALSFVALFFLGACSSDAFADDDDDDDSPSVPAASNCETFTACGGDLVGRWSMRASCVGSAVNDPACKGYASNHTTSGTATYDFGSDGVLRYAGEVTVEYDISVTPECAQAVAHKDVAGYCKLVQDSSDDNPRVPASISCSATDALCACHVEQGPIAGGADSSYEVSGNSVTILADGDVSTFGYCVHGDTLTLGSLAGQPASVFSRD